MADNNLLESIKWENLRNKNPKTKEAMSLLTGFVPGAGDVQSGLLAAQDVQKGNYGSAALNSLGLLPFIPALGGITAWHGSPHTFEKFDLSKMGTGEGAQSFGWGSYLAEHPSVANIYNPRDLKSEEKFLNLYNQAERVGNYPAMQVYEDFMIHKMPNEISLEGLSGKDLIQAKNALNQGTKIYQSQKGSNLYKVDLPDNHIETMLNWDLPLNKQPKTVQNALEKIEPSLYSKKSPDYDASELGQTIYQRLSNTLDKPLRDAWIAKRDSLMENGIKNNPQLLEHLSTNPNPAREASLTLDKYGVKGIKYLDGDSRAIGQGTSNYVVFDPNIIKILERNGLLLP